MLVILIGILASIAVAGLGFVLVGGDPSHAKALKRAQTFTPANAKSDKAKRTGADAANNRRKQILLNLKALERRQRKQSLTMDSRIRQAGLTLSVRNFWIASAVAAVVPPLPILVFVHQPLIALASMFITGIGLPRMLLGAMAKRRLKKFTEEFPNATDVIVRGIKSGLPVNDCLKVIARESPQPLGGEFSKVVEGTGMGLTLDQALEKLHDSMPSAEVRFFAIVLSIQQKTGGNLAEALGNLSSVLRGRKLMREKIKALSGEAVASAFIIGILPPGVMVLVWFLTPSYMTPMFVDPLGHVMLIGGAVWMLIGILIMRKMINFKF